MFGKGDLHLLLTGWRVFTHSQTAFVVLDGLPNLKHLTLVIENDLVLGWIETFSRVFAGVNNAEALLR